MHGMAAFDGSRAGGMGGEMDMEDILAQMFGGMGGGMPAGMGGMGGMGGMPGMNGAGLKKPRKGPNEEIPYSVTLETLYTGKSQKFTATKNVICSHCKGKGGKNHAKPRECSACRGQGGPC